MMLLAAIQKLDEDCKKRRKEHLKAFFEKYETNDGDSEDEVVDLRTLNVVKKGKRKKILDKSYKKGKSVKSKVIKFGELNSYSITLESKKYARQIRKYLRKQNKDSTLDREIDEYDLIQGTNVLTTKHKNSIDKTDNYEKGDLSENRSICSESQNETLPLNSAYNPHFSQFGLHYPANAKLDSLTCDEGQKPRRIEFSTIKRTTKTPVSETPAVCKELSNCSLADKMAAHEIFLKSSRTKFVDSSSRQLLSKNSYNDEHPITKIADPVNKGNISETTKDNMPKILIPSIGKYLSTKKKSAGKNLNRNSEIQNTVPTVKKYPLTNILSSPSKILDYLSKTSDTEDSTGTSSNEEEIIIPDRSSSVSSHLPVSSHENTKFTCNGSSRDKTAPSILSNRKNKSRDTSASIMLNKSNIPPKKNVFPLKKFNAENFNHFYVNPSSRTSQIISTNKSIYNNLPKINGPRVTLVSGQPLDNCSSCVTVKDNSGNEPCTHTSKDATSNSKIKLRNISYSASAEVSKTFPSNDTCTPKNVKKRQPRNVFPSNISKIFDCDSETSDTEVSSKLSIGKPSDEDDIPNLDRSSSVARHLSISSCGRTQNSGGQQLVLNSNVPSRVSDRKHRSQVTSSAVVWEKSNILFTASENLNHGYIKPGNEISGKLLTDKSNRIKDYPKMSTSVAASYSFRSRKDYSISSSVNVKNCSSGGHPVTRSKTRIGYSEDNFKKISSNNAPHIGENSAHKDMSTPQIIKKHSRRSKMSASNTCPVPEISSSSANKNISPPKIVNKQLRCQKMSSPNICSPCGISGNSSKKEVLTIHRVKKHHRSRKAFAHNTGPAKTIDNHLQPSVEVSNKQTTPYTDNFKDFYKYSKSWLWKQRLSIESSQNCSFDDRLPIDRVLRNKHTGSVYYREDELLNTSYIPPEGFLTPLSKRLKFLPNIPMDCLSI